MAVLQEVLAMIDELAPDELEQLRQHIDQRYRATSDAIRAALGDSVIWPDPADDRDAWVEDEAQAIEEAFRGTRSLSAIIIEERRTQR